jgi:hypothetical protein
MKQQDHLGEAMTRNLGALPSAAIRTSILIVAPQTWHGCRSLCSRQTMSPPTKVTRSFIDAATKEHGSSARTFKSGLVWAVPEGADPLRDDARKALAWEDIADEEMDLRRDDGQKRQLAESLKKAQGLPKGTFWVDWTNE